MHVHLEDFSNVDTERQQNLLLWADNISTISADALL